VVMQNLELHQIYRAHDPELAEKKFALARATLHEALATVRQTAQDLHYATEYADLQTALRDYLYTQVPDHVDATATVTGDAEALPDMVCDELFIVLREAIRNAVVHAGASSIQVSVHVGDDKVYAKVEDDGQGFDVATTVDSQSGIGLDSMRERLELLAGELTVTSANGHGTIVSIVTPGVGRFP
jgi:signal transduction histidine kinase